MLRKWQEMAKVQCRNWTLQYDTKVVYYIVTLSTEASMKQLNCVAISTQPPFSFGACLVSS